jgi:hypothetical protein
MDKYQNILDEMEVLKNGVDVTDERIDEINAEISQLTTSMAAGGAVAGSAGQVAGQMRLAELYIQLGDALEVRDGFARQYNDLQEQAQGVYDTLNIAESGGYIGPNDWQPVQDNPPSDPIELHNVGPVT